jgi:hypothetical protein
MRDDALSLAKALAGKYAAADAEAIGLSLKNIGALVSWRFK